MNRRRWVLLALTPIIAGIAGNISLALVPAAPLRWIVLISVLLIVGIGWLILLVQLDQRLGE